MSHAVRSSAEPVNDSIAVSVRPPVLQRRCACGASAGPEGKCAECAGKDRLGGGASVALGLPDDRYEAEADRVANQVISASAPRVQRMMNDEEDPIHAPLIEDFRRRHGLLGADGDDRAGRAGPTDAEIKYQLLPEEALGPYCPDTTIPENPDFSKPAVRDAFKDVNCISTRSLSMPPNCRFTRRQQGLLEAAQSTAAARAQIALARIKAGSEGLRFGRTMAAELFDGDKPSHVEVVATLGKVHRLLSGSSAKFAGHTCGDEECQKAGVLAYVLGPGILPMHICPLAFSPSKKNLHHQILHEALHWAGIDVDTTKVEGYCADYDCSTPCNDKHSADAWTHYVDCLGKPVQLRRDFREKILDSVKDLP